MPALSVAALVSKYFSARICRASRAPCCALTGLAPAAASLSLVAGSWLVL